MIRKKNFGFTIYEVLVTMVIIGIFSTISIPCLSNYYQKYQQKQFEQKVVVFERTTIDCVKKFSVKQNGTTLYTSNQKICSRVETEFIENSEYDDYTNPELINYIAYEILSVSQFEKENYKYEYTPAVFENNSKTGSGVFTLYLNDGMIIKFNMKVYKGVKSITTTFVSCTILKDEYQYNFSI